MLAASQRGDSTGGFPGWDRVGTWEWVCDHRPWTLELSGTIVA